MTDEFGSGCLGLIVSVLIIAASWFSYWCADQDWKTLLLERGVIEYYLDDENDKQWRWVEDDRPE